MKKQSMLIVDDESINVSVLVEMLDDKCHLLGATDGATTLEIANSDENVDLILLDIIMSEMDGYKEARQLKHNKKILEIPFIFLTAKSDTQSIVKGFQDGAVDYVSRLFAKVCNHLQFHKLNSELLDALRALQEKMDELKQSKKVLKELSITDEITKLYNLRYFNEVFKKELNRAKREKRSILFLMLDVDHFKLYNDTYGHQKGDNVLSKIGEVLNSYSKCAGNFAFRLGGEEFGIIFHEDSASQLLMFANKLLKAIEELKIPHAKNLASEFVTVSVGLVYKNIDKTTTVGTIYKGDNDCLYKAKNLGRNRVVSS
ncbi:MAG: diguanylate cyclase [Sulfurimonas sp.]|jgi:diguanylate cyclase (GGDEF)-like protein